MPSKPRKTAKQKAAEDDAITRVQEVHLEATTGAYNMDAAARVAYENFVRLLGLKIGEKVSDASGVHRIPSWGQHKSFIKARWRTLAQAVIDAAVGKPA
jgi:hypothetical protein